MKHMGHYYGAYPENVQSNRQRSRCAICGRKRYRKFMNQLKYSKSWICNMRLFYGLKCK